MPAATLRTTGASAAGISMAETSSRRPDYERSDVSPRLVGLLAAGLAIFLIVTPYLLRAIYPVAMFATAIPPSQSPAPRLQVDPAAELETFRRAEDARLSSYGWIDRQQGIVQLPIGRAIELTAERGLAGWTKP